MCDNELNNEACCFDGGDCPCLSCPYENGDIGRISYYVITWQSASTKYVGGIGNAQCDQWLNTAECCFDGYDCDINSRYYTIINTLNTTTFSDSVPITIDTALHVMKITP